MGAIRCFNSCNIYKSLEIEAIAVGVLLTFRSFLYCVCWCLFYRALLQNSPIKEPGDWSVERHSKCHSWCKFSGAITHTHTHTHTHTQCTYVNYCNWRMYNFLRIFLRDFLYTWMTLNELIYFICKSDCNRIIWMTPIWVTHNSFMTHGWHPYEWHKTHWWLMSDTPRVSSLL